MQLVRIEDAAENAWVHANALALGMPFDIHIDASDAEVEGEWRWSDGTLFWIGATDGRAPGPYQAWGAGEPNDTTGAADCAYLWINRGATTRWHDGNCDDLHAFVCEAR